MPPGQQRLSDNQQLLLHLARYQSGENKLGTDCLSECYVVLSDFLSMTRDGYQAENEDHLGALQH